MRHFRCILAGLALAGRFGVVTPVGAEPRNLGSLKAEVLDYVASGAYEREVAVAARTAEKFILERVERRIPGERLTVILDIDETVLSNLPTMKENDFGWIPAVWDAWVEQAAAPVIRPMLGLFQTARKARVDVVFITGRRERGRAATERNLRATGLGDYAALWMKPDESRETSEKLKTEIRRKLAGEGRVLIANIGDQESDLAGGFAERTFKVPAPFYLTQ